MNHQVKKLFLKNSGRLNKGFCTLIFKLLWTSSRSSRSSICLWFPFRWIWIISTLLIQTRPRIVIDLLPVFIFSIDFIFASGLCAVFSSFPTTPDRYFLNFVIYKFLLFLIENLRKALSSSREDLSRDEREDIDEDIFREKSYDLSVHVKIDKIAFVDPRVSIIS